MEIVFDPRMLEEAAEDPEALETLMFVKALFERAIAKAGPDATPETVDAALAEMGFTSEAVSLDDLPEEERAVVTDRLRNPVTRQ